MKRVVVSGLGFVTSIGNNHAEVLESLRTQRSGIEIHPDLDRPEIPVKLAGTIKGFDFPTENYETWSFPPGVNFSRQQLRSMAPHGVFAHTALNEAIADASLTSDLVSNPRTGLMTASVGSTRMLYRGVEMMLNKGITRVHPLGLTRTIVGTLNFNLVANFEIRGGSTGFVSACSSSAHAFGYALDLIRMGKQDVVFVVGAEDCDLFTLLPFASCRALTRGTDPSKTPCAFDVKRDGFAGTGGAAVLVLEEREHALNRGAKIYAEAAGWGQTSDGHELMAPEPNGEGLARALRLALEDAGLTPNDIDYINAHATSTPAGDRAELRAIKSVFNNGAAPLVSSTKSQTGHGLSLAGALEAAVCCLALREQLVPVSLNITDLDPEAEGVRVVTEPVQAPLRRVISNSSAFGGSNVVLVLNDPAL
ncbi:MAG TPA: beta-ketoacyl-[acyl-carrier-protein] synthase family protein [Chthoniobacterales bacterium]|nr:beta-ketoacyl-[acyl-carrier-protein] synthase family protein [Chthoniobacterales bacterium]